MGLCACAPSLNCHKCVLAHRRLAQQGLPCGVPQPPPLKGFIMSSIVYIVGAVVIIFAVLSFFGLRG
jgi:hypothetical protein